MVSLIHSRERNSPASGDGNWGVSVYISVLSGETARWTVIPSPLNYNVEAGTQSRYGQCCSYRAVHGSNRQTTARLACRGGAGMAASGPHEALGEGGSQETTLTAEATY